MWRLLLGAGGVLFAIALALALLLPGPKHHEVAATAVQVTIPVHSVPTTTAAAATTTAPAPQPPPTPPTVPMSWQNAGGLIVHTSAIDPLWLGQQMRSAGFGWIAVDLDTAPDPDWIARFRTATGFPVGGWSVLGGDPQHDATVAAQAVTKYGLSFYIADAEEPYGYTDQGTTSDTRYARSRVFVATFRNLQPSLPAAVSSYCRPDQHDIDWAAWVKGGFEFLPQAYVNDFGLAASPRECANGAAKWFPRSKIHPVVGSYSGIRGFVSPEIWGRLLRAAGTTGFAIYPAEVGLSDKDWSAFGQALKAARLASLPG
jgi:hypothetical protein